MQKGYIQDKTVFYSGLVYFVIMCLFVGVRIISQYELLGDSQSATTEYIFTIIIQLGLMICLPLFLFKFLAKKPYKQLFSDFGFKRVGAKTILYSVLIGFFVYILVVFVSSFWSGLIQMLGYPVATGGSGSGAVDETPWLSCLLGIIFVGVLPGFCEEFAHRGMVLSSTKANGVWRSVVLAALLFALMHLSITKVGYAFVVGIILGMITVITRSIWPAMIVHFINNSISTYLSYATAYDWFGGGLMNSIFDYLNNSNMFVIFIVSFLILCIVVFILGLLIVKLYSESKKRQYADFKTNLRKNLPNDEMKKDFDNMSEKSKLSLYQETVLMDTKQKIANAHLTETQYMEIMSKRSPVSILVGEGITPDKPKHNIDYLFYYCSIFLGTVVTLMTFLWGVI